jgi:hypothetical protein
MPTLTFADGSDGAVPQSHTVEPYPGAIPALHESMDMQQERVTRDTVEAITKFYDSHKQKDDTLEPFTEENAFQGSQLVYHIKEQGVDHSYPLVTIQKNTNDSPFPLFRELEIQVQQGRHTQAELDQLKNEYQVLVRAFYRQVPGENGKPQDEGAMLFNKYVKLAHPEAEKAAGQRPKKENQAKDIAKRDDLKKRVQALKAKGDYQGLIKLSQEAANYQAASSGVTQAELQPGATDNWDIWVKCMHEMKAAAYWTKIIYKPNTLLLSQK